MCWNNLEANLSFFFCIWNQFFFFTLNENSAPFSQMLSVNVNIFYFAVVYKAIWWQAVTAPGRHPVGSFHFCL